MYNSVSIDSDNHYQSNRIIAFKYLQIFKYAGMIFNFYSKGGCKLKKLENKLMDSVRRGSKKEALIDYKKLICKYENSPQYYCSLRSFKSYLICINCILYNSCDENKISKENIFEKRNDFIFKIDKKTSFESLYTLGKDFILFYTHTNRSKYSYTQHEIVNQALKYIHCNLNRNLTLNKVAREVHISKSHLSRLFLIHTNSSFSNYISKVRIDYAKILLRETSKALVDVAFECGFNSQSYFCSTFKRVEGISPLNYKNASKS